ncbi:GtrA family protein [Paenibacillus elgii]|uniref:GtrA family protein n=1 Tax=Paenibacillus elgii TaxID=189691 RepID=UPI00398B76CE
MFFVMDKILIIVKYFFFGVLTTIINILTFKLLIDGSVEYKLATSIAWMASVIFAFITNKLWVFNSRTKKWNDLFSEFTKFLFGRVSTYIVDLFGLMLLVQLFKVDTMLSKIILNIIVIILNYFLAKFSYYPGKERT